MTEAEWLACDEPAPMLTCIKGEVSARKLRLFALACCHRLTPRMTRDRDRWFLGALSTAEQFVERGEDGTELFVQADQAHRFRGPEEMIRYVSAADAWEGAWRAAQVTWELMYGFTDEWRAKAERILLARRIRCIFGDICRPGTFSSEWRTDTAIALARQMYDSREFSAMPILADALQDAGCDNDEMLNHCRAPGVHVRGCWVVDLVLGKE